MTQKEVNKILLQEYKETLKEKDRYKDNYNALVDTFNEVFKMFLSLERKGLFKENYKADIVDYYIAILKRAVNDRK